MSTNHFKEPIKIIMKAYRICFSAYKIPIKSPINELSSVLSTIFKSKGYHLSRVVFYCSLSEFPTSVRHFRHFCAHGSQPVPIPPLGAHISHLELQPPKKMRIVARQKHSPPNLDTKTPCKSSLQTAGWSHNPPPHRFPFSTGEQECWSF